MKPAEFALFRFLESLTVYPAPARCPEPGPECELATGRGYLVKTAGGWELTAAGEKWLGLRMAHVSGECAAGRHALAAKSEEAKAMHCRFCGACASPETCLDCVRDTTEPF